MIGHFECTLNAGLNCKYIRSTSDFLRLHNRHRRNFIIIIRCWLCFAIAPADTFMCGRQNVFQLKSSWPFYLSLLFYIFFFYFYFISALVCLFEYCACTRLPSAGRLLRICSVASNCRLALCIFHERLFYAYSTQQANIPIYLYSVHSCTAAHTTHIARQIGSRFVQKHKFIISCNFSYYN